MNYAVEIDGNFTPILSEQYDPVAHRFWRFQDDGPMLRWLVSADGNTWTLNS